MELNKVQKSFVTRWGEMGGKWGVNRTVAQVHALLFIAAKPLDAGEISETLSIARSNISTALRDLENWGLIRVVHVLGDRKGHFEATGDAWEMFRAIIIQRKQREFDPILETAKQCMEELGRNQKTTSAGTAARLAGLVEVLELSDSFYRALSAMPLPLVKRLMKLGPKVQGLLGG